MISFANAQIQGNVGTVTIDETTGKKPYARLSVCTTDSYRKDEEWVTVTNWITAVTFNPGTVKYIERNVAKGREVFVSGNLRTGSYEKDGLRRTSIDLHIDDIKVGKKVRVPETDIPETADGEAQDAE